MILSAGLGKRLQPITLKTPKSLIELEGKNLLERTINLLISYGIEEIVINVHHLANQIINFINKKKYSIKITISDEKDLLLGTGGGIYQGTKIFKKKPFIVINPDTLWNKNYSTELNDLVKLYFKTKKSCLLLVDKELSFDNSFKGDFNLIENIVCRNTTNKFIFTGLQVLDRSVFESTKEKIFSMNDIWDNLIKNKTLLGIPSNQKFYHLNTREVYEKLSNFKIID